MNKKDLTLNYKHNKEEFKRQQYDEFSVTFSSVPKPINYIKGDILPIPKLTEESFAHTNNYFLFENKLQTAREKENQLIESRGVITKSTSEINGSNNNYLIIYLGIIKDKGYSPLNKNNNNYDNYSGYSNGASLAHFDHSNLRGKI